MMRRSVQFSAGRMGRGATVGTAVRHGCTDYAWRDEEIERENKLREEASKGMSQLYSIKNPNVYVHCLPGGGSKGGVFSSSSNASASTSSSSGGAPASGSPFAAISSMFSNNKSGGGGGDNGGGGNDDKKPEYKPTMTDSFLLATGFLISVYSFKVMYNRQFGNHGDAMDSPVPIWVAGSPETKGKYFLFSCITDAEERHRIFAEFSQARTVAIQQVIAHNQQVTRAIRERQHKQQQQQQQNSTEGASTSTDGAADAPADEATYQYIGVPAHFNDFFTWMDTVYPTWCIGRRYTSIPQIQSILAAGMQGMEGVGGAALHQAVSELSAETAAANRAAAAEQGKPVAPAQWSGLTSMGSPLSMGTIRDRTDRVDAFLEAAQKVTSGNGGIMSLFGLGGNATPKEVPPFQQQQSYGGGGYYGMPPPQQHGGGANYNNTAPPPANNQQWQLQQQYTGNPYGNPQQQQQPSGQEQLHFAPPTPQHQYPPYSAPSPGALMNVRGHMQQFHSPNNTSATPVGGNVNADHNGVYHGSGTGYYGGGGPQSGGRPSTFMGSEEVSLKDIVGDEVVPQKGSKDQ